MTINDIFRQYGQKYLKFYGARMLPSHKKLIHDLAQCRRPSMGTIHWYCEHCQKDHFSYAPCKNRSCPSCQSDHNVKWLIKQFDLKLPVEYFMATFTLPDKLSWRAVNKNFSTIYFSSRLHRPF